MKIEFAIYTNIGDCRVNEDTVAVIDKGSVKCFLLADGLGGHGGGDIASAHIASVVESVVNKANALDERLIHQCFVQAQNSLLELQKKMNKEQALKTTLVMLLTDGITWTWGHIGDSRLYYFSNGRIKYVTSDHSVPQMMLKMGKIKPEELKHHPERNILLKVMGTAWTEPAYEVDVTGKKIEKGDAFLLCSDGFWEWVEDSDMEKLVSLQASAENIVSQMGTLALKNGMDKESERDNLSAILVRVIG